MNHQTAMKLERMAKGYASHHRLRVLSLLHSQPEQTLQDLASGLQLNIKTASEHMRKMTIAGLVLKRREHHHVRHRLSPVGEKIYIALQKFH